MSNADAVVLRPLTPDSAMRIRERIELLFPEFLPHRDASEYTRWLFGHGGYPYCFLHVYGYPKEYGYPKDVACSDSDTHDADNEILAVETQILAVETQILAVETQIFAIETLYEAGFKELTNVPVRSGNGVPSWGCRWLASPEGDVVTLTDDGELVLEGSLSVLFALALLSGT